MKKITTWLAAFWLLAIILAVFSCQKQRGDLSFNDSVQTTTTESQDALSKAPVTRAYRDSFDASLHFVPDIAAGWTYPNNSPAWFHGNGTGNATHMGNVMFYFNQYTLKNSAGVTIVYYSPVNMFYASQLQSFNVPSNVTGVIFDDKGNSIWLRNSPDGIPSKHISLTRINLDGTMLIVGGTGKFVGATGETSFHGFFNPLNLQECSLWQNGWIRY